MIVDCHFAIWEKKLDRQHSSIEVFRKFIKKLEVIKKSFVTTREKPQLPMLKDNSANDKWSEIFLSFQKLQQ